MNLQDIIEEVKRAVATQSDIEIEYFKSNGELSKRRVSNVIYDNEFKSYGYHNDHIEGYCHLRNEDRVFKISRILSIRVLPDGKKVENSELIGMVGRPSQYPKSSGNNDSFSTSSIYEIDSSSSESTESENPRVPFDPLEYANMPTTHSTSSTPKPPQPSSGGGCYIATMAYGSYEHPQVMVLRRYRDRVLLQSGVGRLFVRVYYKVSPKMVEVLKHSETINKWIRKWLDKKVERVRRKYNL